MRNQAFQPGALSDRKIASPSAFTSLPYIAGLRDLGIDFEMLCK